MHFTMELINSIFITILLLLLFMLCFMLCAVPHLYSFVSLTVLAPLGFACCSYVSLFHLLSLRCFVRLLFYYS